VAGILIVIQVGFTYLPIMNTLFCTVPIRFVDWSYSVVAGVVIFFIVELEKELTIGMRKKYDVF
jgi:Ca2+-transporting ATPase